MSTIMRNLYILAIIFYTMIVHVAYAERVTGNGSSHMDTYRCGGPGNAIQRVDVNLGGQRGFVQLDIPVVSSQVVPIYQIKQCLLQNGLMSKEEFTVYRQAIETCRRAYQQGKVQFTRGKAKNFTTRPAFNFDHCLRDNLLD